MRLQIANQLMIAGRFDQAEAILKQVVSAEPDNHQALQSLARLYFRQRDFERSIELLERVLAADPENTGLLAQQGQMLQETGRFERAKEHFRRAMKIAPEVNDLYVPLVTISRYEEIDDDVRAMERLYADTHVGDEKRSKLGFALGKVYDDLGEFDKAFRFFAEANRIERSKYRIDLDAAARTDERIREIFGASWVAGHAGRGNADSTPIFVTGLGRSGTTLVEQILASHPQVYGAGEAQIIGSALSRLQAALGVAFPDGYDDIPSRALGDAADVYLSQLRKRATGEPRITDKNLGIERYLGLLHIMFPGARIVHCQRDPLDQGLSLFQKDFGAQWPHSYDLGDIGRHYGNYRAMMAHWRQVLPDAICEVTYEYLVDDLEPQVRRLLDFCELPFDPACLSFHETRRIVHTHSLEQVRQPLYRGSMQRWKNYEKHLQPLIDAIEQSQ